MRLSAVRRSAVAVLVAVPLVFAAAACSSSKSSSGAGVTVTGDVGKKASVTIPKGNPPKDLTVSVAKAGSGKTVQAGDFVVVNATAKVWQGAKDLGSTYSDGTNPTQPQGFVIGASPSQAPIPAYDKSLIGKKVGSRVVVVTPPADAWGSQGNSQAGISGTDTVVFVLDIANVYPGDAHISGSQPLSSDPTLPTVLGDPSSGKPKITIPAGKAAPTKLVANTLINGSGKTVAKGQTLVVEYTGVIWASGKEFDSSYTHKAPAAFPIGVGAVVPGWDAGLVGKKVGDRVLLVLPPDQGYGSQGQSQAGIKGTDTLVFVVDIIDAF